MAKKKVVPQAVYRSFAIPDGLVMDPLAPTALAVSTEFMERIGSGLTILRDHGKKVQKCVIDLSQLEKERTHDMWSELECGHGSLHLLVTLSGSARNAPVDNVPTTIDAVQHCAPIGDDYTWYRLDNDWSEVGQLSVTVYSARGLSALGLSGKADPYCVLELDNSRLQTHTVRATNEPTWNKNYNFAINDVTSTLDITVYDESIISSIKGETLGKISIPLLRINNNEKRWYALKNRSKTSSAKGNCPRILLQMSVVWNPIKASLRVLTPKETKYTKKSPTFSIPLIYNNLKFIKTIFDVVDLCHEHIKYVFEWDNREKCTIALTGWLIFWFFFRMWMAPMLVLAPFIYHWTTFRGYNNTSLIPVCTSDDDLSDDELESNRDDKSIKMRLYGLQDFTFTIKNGIDYIVSLLERIKNLVNFSVPYLSFLAMAALVVATLGLYLIPANYLFMGLGIYKFTRKFLNPDRVPNNDILDFISRVPDNRTLRKWQELKVPEPNLSRNSSAKRR